MDKELNDWEQKVMDCVPKDTIQGIMWRDLKFKSALTPDELAVTIGWLKKKGLVVELFRLGRKYIHRKTIQ